MKNHYSSHNAKMLQQIAGKEHEAWLKKRAALTLRKAKRDVAPMMGKTLTSFRQLKAFKKGN